MRGESFEPVQTQLSQPLTVKQNPLVIPTDKQVPAVRTRSAIQYGALTVPSNAAYAICTSLQTSTCTVGLKASAPFEDCNR